MEIITTKTSALDYIENVMIIPGQYENGALYLALYDTEEQELYTDLSTYIMPVLPNEFYVKTGSEEQRFCEEQTDLFISRGKTVKQGFNTYSLYYFNGFLH